MNRTPLYLLTVGFLSFLVALPLNIVGEGCEDLDPNSEPYRDEGNVVHCRCRQGYVKWNGHCRVVEEVRTRLEERLKNAQKGHKVAVFALTQLNRREIAAHALDAIKSGELLGALTGAGFVKQTAIVEVKLVTLASDMPDCSQNNMELRTACENNKTFLRLIQETRLELKKLPPP